MRMVLRSPWVAAEAMACQQAPTCSDSQRARGRTRSLPWSAVSIRAANIRPIDSCALGQCDTNEGYRHTFLRGKNTAGVLQECLLPGARTASGAALRLEATEAGTRLSETHPMKSLDSCQGFLMSHAVLGSCCSVVPPPLVLQPLSFRPATSCSGFITAG